jgi:Recombinase
MSDTERVRAWRDRLKQEGRVPMTIWIKADTKARYEDLALTYHRSPSELAQQALDAYHPDAMVSATASDTEQLRTLIRAEMAKVTADVTAAVTAAVTETLMAMVQELVQATIAAGASATETDTETVTEAVTTTETAAKTITQIPAAATATDTETVTQTRNAAAPPATATVTATSTDTSTTAYDADAAYARMQALQAQGLSLAQIAAQMTAEGRRTRHGKPWHKSTVAYVLKTHGR